MNESESRESKLIQRLSEKFADDDTTAWDELDFLYAKGSALAALWYSRLFWPEFVEIDGMVFLTRSMSSADDRARLADAVKTYGRDRRAIEQGFNSVEAAWLFDTLDLDDGEYLWLLERLVEMWRCRLHALYPRRRFEVVLQDADDWNDVRITFHQA